MAYDPRIQESRAEPADDRDAEDVPADDGPALFVDAIAAAPEFGDLRPWEPLLEHIGRCHVVISDNPNVPEASDVDVEHDGIRVVFIRRVPDGRVLDHVSLADGHWHASPDGVDVGQDDTYHFTLLPTDGDAPGFIDALDEARMGAVPEGAPAIVRAYSGRRQADADSRFQDEVVVLARYGYRPTSQSWTPGRWGYGAFLLALLTIVLVIGIITLVYLLLVKPDGTLTVTYTLEAGRAASPQYQRDRWRAPLSDRRHVPDPAERATDQAGRFRRTEAAVFAFLRYVVAALPAYAVHHWLLSDMPDEDASMVSMVIRLGALLIGVTVGVRAVGLSGWRTWLVVLVVAFAMTLAFDFAIILLAIIDVPAPWADALTLLLLGGMVVWLVRRRRMRMEMVV